MARVPTIMRWTSAVVDSYRLPAPDMRELKAVLRRFRDNRVGGFVVRLPFSVARHAGAAIPRRLTRHLIYRGTFTVQCPGGSRFRMKSWGHELENNVYWHGVWGYEPECVVPWIRFAARARTVLDIGANTGFYSLMAACLPSRPRVHAFEPVARISELLRANCRLNPDLNITVHECAIGATDGSTDLFDPGGDNCYSASTSPVFLDQKTDRYSVRAARIDSVVQERRLTGVDLVKLDVEGCEEMALDGMIDTIRQFRPTIMLELLSPPRRALVERVGRLLLDDYQLFQMYRDRLKAYDSILALPGTFNVLLNPREKRLPETLEHDCRDV